VITNRIGISYTPFSHNIIATKNELIGGASYEDKDSYTIGINYLTSIKKWLEFESGIEYSEHKILIGPAPGIEGSEYSTRLSLINLPVTLKANLTLVIRAMWIINQE
jgi:hypothetical protein